MNSEIDTSDLAEKNKPQRPPMNPKTKKVLTYLLCGIIGIAIAAGGIYGWSIFSKGSATPQEAVANYLEASLLYDVDGMIKYSSDYNKTVLYGNQETGDTVLKATLETAYENRESEYTEDSISVQLVSVMEYSPEETKFQEIMKYYKEKDSDAEDTVDKFAIVEMVLTKGENTTTTEYLAVKVGTRWYYGKANA